MQIIFQTCSLLLNIPSDLDVPSLQIQQMYVKRNMDARSCNHCCNGKAVSHNLSVYSQTQVSSMQCACTTYRHLWLVRLYDIFLRCLLKDKIFGKNVFKKTCFDFPLQLWSATFLTLRRIQRDVIINVHRSSNRTLWSIVRRMEVDCENKTFAAAGMLCPSELGTLVPRRSGK